MSSSSFELVSQIPEDVEIFGGRDARYAIQRQNVQRQNVLRDAVFHPTYSKAFRDKVGLAISNLFS